MVAPDWKKILIVDDETSILSMLKETFNLDGYRVRTAESGEEALKILKEETFMVMFLDLRLPGMSGIDLCWKIRERDQVSIIYAITGYSSYYGLVECRNAGFDDFFVKPVETRLLLNAAEEAFDKLERWKIRDYELL
jgi:DNA-binding response OmpR family regulator